MKLPILPSHSYLTASASLFWTQPAEWMAILCGDEMALNRCCFSGGFRVVHMSPLSDRGEKMKISALSRLSLLLWHIIRQTPLVCIFHSPYFILFTFCHFPASPFPPFTPSEIASYSSLSHPSIQDYYYTTWMRLSLNFISSPPAFHGCNTDWPSAEGKVSFQGHGYEMVNRTEVTVQC